jgi:hypothetical protein
MIMLIKNAEKLRKTTLRERIYEEVVRLILSGELPSGGWVDEKQVVERLRVSRTRFARRSGYLQMVGGRDQALSRLLCAQLFSQRDRGPLRNYTSGLNVSRSSSPYRK